MAHDKPPPRDRAGLGCVACDPIVRVTTYGVPGDPFVRVVDSLNADGSEAAAKKLVRQINAEGGRATLLGLYERKSTW